jgi:hypothetical protein
MKEVHVLAFPQNYKVGSSDFQSELRKCRHGCFIPTDSWREEFNPVCTICLTAAGVVPTDGGLTRKELANYNRKWLREPNPKNRRNKYFIDEEKSRERNSTRGPHRDCEEAGLLEGEAEFKDEAAENGKARGDEAGEDGAS